MVDLGSHAGHGVGRNVSDALLWLDHFHDAGSTVLGVDAFEDYALDLQHRFDAVAPYKSMARVRKISLHAAIGVAQPSNRLFCDPPAWWAASTAAASASAAAAGGPSTWPCVDLANMAAYSYAMCTRTDWYDDYERMDRHRASDHVCRITRQRAGLSTSTLPLPPSARAYRLTSKTGGPPHLVPLATVDELLRAAVPGHTRIDFLKVDFDEPWADAAPAGLMHAIAARRFAVMTIEIDHRLDRPPSATIENISCAGAAADYATFVKVPCAGGGVWRDRLGKHLGFHPLTQRAAYMPISHKYHARFSAGWGVDGGRAVPCARGGEHCAIQDLLLLDLRMPELRELVRLGNEECGTAFPDDVDALWAAGDAARKVARTPRAAATSPRSMSLVGEQEERRPMLWQDPLPKVARAARWLPDGSPTCRLAKENATVCKT